METGQTYYTIRLNIETESTDMGNGWANIKKKRWRSFG